MGEIDYYRIRRANVRELILKRYRDVFADFAEAVGVDQTTVSRWFMDGPGRKNIGEKNARRIENVLKLRDHALDIKGEASKVSAPPHQGSDVILSTEEMEFLNAFRAAPEPVQKALMNALSLGPPGEPPPMDDAHGETAINFHRPRKKPKK